MDNPEIDQQLIYNDATGEEILMECGEELEPLETITEFIDHDNPIQFNEDQIAFQLLNLLSHNDADVLKHKSTWNRRVREFSQVLKDSKTEVHNTFLYPVICADRILVKETYDGADEDVEEHTKLTTTDNLLQERTYLVTSKMSDATIVPKLIRLERIWSASTDCRSHVVTEYMINEDTDAFIHTDTILTRVKLFKGDVVPLSGFLYSAHDAASTPIMVDVPEYKRFLQSIVISSTVTVVSHQTGDEQIGEVVSIEGSIISIRLANDEMVSIDNSAIAANEYMIYDITDTSSPKFSKSCIKSHNILFNLDDIPLRANIDAVVPNLAEILLINAEVMKTLNNLCDIRALMSSYGIDFRKSLDAHALIQVRNMMHANMSSFTADKTVPIKRKHMRPFKSAAEMLDFERHADLVGRYAKYAFKNMFNDTEYNRMLHLFSQGDSGLIYSTGLVGKDLDAVYSHVDKHIDTYKSELVEVRRMQEDIKKKSKHMECLTFNPEISKIYSNLGDLEADNFKVIQGIKEGDYAKVNNTLYKRIATPDGAQLWTKHRLLNEQLCSDDSNMPPSGSKCSYDDAAKVCAAKEYLVAKNKLEQLVQREAVLNKLLELHEHYGTLKIEQHQVLQSLIADLAIDYKKRYNTEIRYEDVVDYSQYSGQAGADDENRFANAEVGEGIKYAALPAENKRFKKAAVTSLVDTLVIHFGIYLDDDSIDYIKKNNDFYNNEVKLNAVINKAKRDLDEQAKLAIAKALANNKNADRIKIAAKVHEGRDAKLKHNTDILRKGFKKDSILMICALFVLKVQLQLPNVKVNKGYASCNKSFGLEGFPLNDSPKSLVNYVACIVKALSTPNDETFEMLHAMPLSEIVNEIQKHIKKLLHDKQDGVEGLNAVRELLKNANIHRTHVDVDEYGEWENYRPVLSKSMHKSKSTLVEYIDLMYQIAHARLKAFDRLEPGYSFMSAYSSNAKFQGDHKKLKHTTIIHPLGHGYYDKQGIHERADLFSQKPIELGRAGERSLAVKHHGVQATNVMETTLKVAMESLNDDTYWNLFPDQVEQQMEVLLSKFSFNKDVISQMLSIMFSVADNNAVKVRNAYRMFLFSDVRTILGKLAYNWAPDTKWIRGLPQIDGKKNEHERVNDVVSLHGKMSDVALALNGHPDLKQAISKVLRELSDDVLNTPYKYYIQGGDEESIKKQIYIYDYVLVHVLYKLVKLLGTDDADDLYNISSIVHIDQVEDQPTVAKMNVMFDVLTVIMEKFVSKMKHNTFNAADLTRKHEELRELRKTDIIRRLETLSDEQKQKALELQKLGLIKWTDIPYDEEGNDKNEDKMPKLNEAEVIDNNLREQGENEQMDFKGYDRDDDYAKGLDDPDDDDDELIPQDMN